MARKKRALEDAELQHEPRDALDITLKSLWRVRPEGLLRFATGDESIRLVRVLDAQPIAIRRSVDGVALVVNGDGPYIQHLEFETSPDGRELAARVYVYATHLFAMMKHEYPVRSTVVLLEDRLPNLQPQFTMVHGEEELGRYRFRVKRLRDLPPSEFLDDPVRAGPGPWCRSPRAPGTLSWCGPERSSRRRPAPRRCGSCWRRYTLLLGGASTSATSEPSSGVRPSWSPRPTARLKPGATRRA